MNISMMLVEDDLELGEIVHEMLELIIESDVEWLKDGQEALNRLQESKPDVIVLDLHMPCVSGIEILRYVRNDARLINTKVIMMTADALGAKVTEGVADLILIKPVKYDDLLQLVEHITN